MRPKELIALFLLMLFTIILAAAAKSRFAKANDQFPWQRSILHRSR